MRERERKEKNLIQSQEDILNRYPGLFNSFNLEDQTCYLENPNQQKIGLFRFMILPAGVVAVSSYRKDYIWDIEKYRDKDVLFTIISDLVNEKVESNTTNIKDLVQELHFDYNEYFLRILPYSDNHSSSVITSILDQRYEDIQNQTPLTEI